MYYIWKHRLRAEDAPHARASQLPFYYFPVRKVDKVWTRGGAVEKKLSTIVGAHQIAHGVYQKVVLTFGWVSMPWHLNDCQAHCKFQRCNIYLVFTLYLMLQ